MAVKELKIDGVVMPSPALEGVKISREKIWSDDSGRTTSGKFVGTIIGIKIKISISWPTLTTDQAAIIENAVSNTTAFHTIELYEMDGNKHTHTVYFSSPQYGLYSWAAGKEYVDGVSVDAIEQ